MSDRHKGESGKFGAGTENRCHLKRFRHGLNFTRIKQICRVTRSVLKHNVFAK